MKFTIPLQYPAAFSGCIIMTVTGMLFSWTSPSLPQLLAPDAAIQITTTDGSWIAIMPCITASLGCLLAGKFVDNIGRKKCLLLASPLYLTAWIMIAFASNKYFFYGARFISGIGDGLIITALPMYIGEIADSKIRGLLGSTVSTSLVLGFLLVAVLGSACNIHNAAISASFLPIVYFTIFCCMPESPYYLLMKNELQKATESLIQLRGTKEVTREIKFLEVSVREDMENRKSIWDLFTVESNRKAVYIIMVMRGLQQLSGALVITLYTTIIFAESGTDLSPDACTNIYFGIQVIFSVVCSCLVDRIGRRPLLIISAFGSFLTLAIQGGYFYIKDVGEFDLTGYKWIPLAALLSYNVLFSLGMGNIPSLLLGELFPTSVKAFALSLADVYMNVVVIIGTEFLQNMNDSMGMSIPFFVFSASSLISLIYVIKWLPETTGKTLEEIQEGFKSANSSNIPA